MIRRFREGDEEICIGSIEELINETKNADKILGLANSSKLTANSLDLHKPYVDDIILVSKSGKPMNRGSRSD